MVEREDPRRIERRAAMKAALAGATMAMASEPPRILSLTTAPGMAQAATQPCVNGSTTVQHPINDPSAECWGTSTPVGCNDLVIGPGVHGSFTITVTISGSDIKGDPSGGGLVAVGLEGLGPGAVCSVFAAATCVPAQAQPLPVTVRSPANGSPARTTIRANGIWPAGDFKCGGRWPESVTVTVACRCSGS